MLINPKTSPTTYQLCVRALHRHCTYSSEAYGPAHSPQRSSRPDHVKPDSSRYVHCTDIAHALLKAYIPRMVLISLVDLDLTPSGWLPRCPHASWKRSQGFRHSER